MISTDFVYDGQSLSSYGFIICDFESGDGVNEIDTGSVLTFNKTPMNNGQYHALTSSNYEQCFGITFDICKDPDLYDLNKRIITDSEYATIHKWLNRKKFYQFNFVNNKNLLEITSETKIQEGLTFTVDKKAGTITASGTATADAQFDFQGSSPKSVNSGTIKNGLIFSCKGTSSNLVCAISYYDSSGAYISEQRATTSGTNISIPSNTNSYKFWVRKKTAAGSAAFVFEPMLREASITDDTFEPYHATCYFDASFNISKIVVNGGLYGIRLNMETNRPFGYGDFVTVTKTYTSNNTSFTIENQSEELGYTYPTIKVKCTQAGNVTITNTTTQNTVVINNLSVNEEVEINGLAQTIKTSKTTHKIADDFNYEFLPLQNSINNSNNVIEATPCKLTISYNPIIKSIKL